jgi:hypothetical protein
VVGGAVAGGGAVVSGGTSVSVVSLGVVVIVVVGDGFVVDDGLVVDGGGLTGPPPPLPLASTTRPQMIVVIRITTAKPHSARTHGLRYQAEGSPAEANSSSLFSPSLESLWE